MTSVTYASAIDEAIRREMRLDPSVFLMATSPPRALVSEFGPERVRRTPISELAVTGVAVGAAMCGFRPVVNWRNITFSFVAFEQVVNQAAKLRYMTGGQCKLPVVFRGECGGGTRRGAQHSQSAYSLYAHVPGLKVILPASVSDALGLMISAIRDDNPVLCFEGSRLSTTRADLSESEAVVPLGVARTCLVGTDVTIVALSSMVPEAILAAKRLSVDGIAAEVIDPRTVVPLDWSCIRESICKTRRLLIVDEAPPVCSIASDIAARAAEDPETFASLLVPTRRLCAAPVPVPASGPLEDYVLPDSSQIEIAARALLDASRSR